MRLSPLRNHGLRRWLLGGKRIVILMHENTRRSMLDHYSLFRFTPTWIEDGHQVILARGTDRPVPGDLVIVHVDLSLVPEPYLEFASRYPIALNGRLRDIRKSAISTQLVGPDSDWPGPVIVKSDLNYGGRPEHRLLGDRPAEAGGIEDYRIYEHLAQVPPRHFENPGLVVEKFRPERQDGLYHVRTFHVLGDAWHGYRHGSPQPLVKMSNVM